MVRRDHWKLNYYHGMEPQLFNLAEDPRETRDLARDPGCSRIRRELEGEVLDGWDPEVYRRQDGRNPDGIRRSFRRGPGTSIP